MPAFPEVEKDGGALPALLETGTAIERAPQTAQRAASQPAAGLAADAVHRVGDACVLRLRSGIPRMVV